MSPEDRAEVEAKVLPVIDSVSALRAEVVTLRLLLEAAIQLLRASAAIKKRRTTRPGAHR